MPFRDKGQGVMAPAARQMTAACTGVAANVLLGLSALFRKAPGALPPGTLLAIRIVASLLTLMLVMAMPGRLHGLARRLGRRSLAIHAAAALLVACNWHGAIVHHERGGAGSNVSIHAGKQA